MRRQMLWLCLLQAVAVPFRSIWHCIYVAINICVLAVFWSRPVRDASLPLRRRCMDFGALRAHLPAYTAGLLTVLTRAPPVPVVLDSSCECSCDCSGVGRLASAGLVLAGAGLVLLLQLLWRSVRWGTSSVRHLRDAPVTSSRSTSPPSSSGAPAGYVIPKKA
jgi:hypothetical protein